MAAPTEDGFAQFDGLLSAADTSHSPWTDSTYIPNLDLLQQMLSLPISQGDKQESGRPAKAFDAWVAHELRRSGFPADAVFPRMRRPRVLFEGLGSLEAKIEELAAALESAEPGDEKVKPAPLRRAIRAVTGHNVGQSTAYILGDFYAKQIDVGLSTWERGPDILISTKTMFSAFGKNLKNRHEEAVGEVSSLRRRHPMAAMGYCYLVREDIVRQPNAYATLYDILHRLRRPGEAFDATLLLAANWDDNDPSAGVQLLDEPAAELSASRFFKDIVEAVMDRSPNRIHQEVRRRRGGTPFERLDISWTDDIELGEDVE
ncbi:MAG: hypothetical protein JWP74_525 [Marmoricola sp.]|nr:hypothetical protein [Marmoricola sp.]